MGKLCKTVSLKGQLDIMEPSKMTVTEITKDDTKVYNLTEVLAMFHDKNINISIRQEKDLPTVDDDDDGYGGGHGDDEGGGNE